MCPLDLTRLKTYPLSSRKNLVHYHDLVFPDSPAVEFDSLEFSEVVGRIAAARSAGRPVIAMLGAHVVKCGLSPLIVDLLERHLLTHLAGNGAVSIHDFELSLIGETSEDVAQGLEDGSFGMAEETGALMHRAIRQGVRDGLGYGASLGRFIGENPQLFPYRQVGVLYNAYRLGIPATIHVTIGADIIHQHPEADFAAMGTASGRDFYTFTNSISDLEGGAFLNFGSAVTGPEVFLKALTMVRNLGYPVFSITTANFDLHPLPDYRSPIDDAQPDYYYRPLKNIVNRPTALGGKGFHITGDHKTTIPSLHRRMVSSLKQGSERIPEISTPRMEDSLTDLLRRAPTLSGIIPDTQKACAEIGRCLKTGGTLFLAGNGGSMADALHISAELLKSYTQTRPLHPSLLHKLESQPDGELLQRNLQAGMRAVVLGANLSLSSAVANDMPDRDMNLAQELLALARPGDVYMGLSTSGNARNIYLAAQTARALGLTVISLTGEPGGSLAEFADVHMRVPAQETARVQELHILVYHALCEMLERDLVAQNSASEQIQPGK